MDRGLLKEISFQKTDQEFLPEARYESEGSDAVNQLANVYDVTFTMLGNSLYQPGQYIYFDPISIGLGHPNTNNGKGDRSWSNLMGLGGYHLVTEVASSIKPGNFTTSVRTRWVTSGQPNST